MKLFVTDFEGVEHELEGLDGWRVMEIIRDYGLPMKAECGGACLCGTCHVYVSPEWQDKLYPKRDDEEDRLMEDAIGVEDNSRLSCQILMSDELDGLKVTMAPGSLKD
ncbi:MAG: 2Fe-2S iron-sulfur cluster binding domain-containing protein [Alphaproteobacteria bacterium]|nr:2Fe-2S iron-sulfur cluster binding domain-containing protein [Alphaproteobacteria bacterium]MCB1550975.1 2Fe-2S iron-sulfur cluster binding domain-containing protein [Alphaproteobacteria bacterium]MCB9984151.1 2Fe-2S iron-sulfur cluster binding domain-containing protein [Micavibrio sp.]HPQ50536.1 2Fe-2S iron-sulfur cluster-binding protein [Alphaproteobacteria bacterium]HRK96998.1 2Fe-2S iron-sulfur cluster-binding protein [Alphaproteobacteria bacterium]